MLLAHVSSKSRGTSYPVGVTPGPHTQASGAPVGPHLSSLRLTRGCPGPQLRDTAVPLCGQQRCDLAGDAPEFLFHGSPVALQA